MRRLCLTLLAALALAAPAEAAPLLTTTVTQAGGTPAFHIPKGEDAGVFLQGGTETLQLEASPDGVTWYVVYAAGAAQLYIWSLSGNNIFDTVSGVGGLTYRFNCTSYTSNVVITVLGPAS